MAAPAAPTFDQHIRLDAVVRDGRLVATRLVTTRDDGLVGRLAGRRLEEIPALVSRLFPLCGMAHAIAALTAIEQALSIEVSPAQFAWRELVLLAERGAALGWRILMDWPPLLDEAPAVRACAEFRRAAAAVNRTASPGQLWQIGGGHRQLDRITLGVEIAALARMLDALFPEAGDQLSLRELELAIERGRSVPARLIRFARQQLPAAYGHHELPMLSRKDAPWFAARLAGEARFSTAPTLDGVPAEVGPLAAERHALVSAAAAQWGKTLATRLLACALDASVTAAALRRTAERVADCEPLAFDRARSGRGAGVVETARGPLAYFIEAANGRARSLRNVAPTEWNFHADGPFMAALRAAPRTSDPLRAARMLAASFDPCVPLNIVVADTKQPVVVEVGCDA